MKEYNQILLQLNKAIECANSIYPQEKAIGVILFDNLIELQLYRLAKSDIFWDEASRDGGREIKKQDRDNIVGEKGKYDRLVKFCKDKNYITANELEILKFVHEIRNGIYHRGEDDKLKVDIALLAYYSLLKKNIITWASRRRFTAIMSGVAYEPINFGQELDKDIKSIHLDHRNYFQNALDFLLAKWQISNRLDEKVIELFSKQIRRMKSGLFFIKSNITELNYYETLSHYWHLNNLFAEYTNVKRKPKNLDSVMLLALYIRENEDSLNDIDDIVLRQKTGRSLLYKHRLKYKGKYPYWVDLSKIEARVKNLNGKAEHSIIKNLIDIQNNLHNLYLDIGEAASNIDGYIQEELDRLKGK